MKDKAVEYMVTGSDLTSGGGHIMQYEDPVCRTVHLKPIQFNNQYSPQ